MDFLSLKNELVWIQGRTVKIRILLSLSECMFFILDGPAVEILYVQTDP